MSKAIPNLIRDPISSNPETKLGMTLDNQNTGRLGEEIAVSYLKSKGYVILQKNYRSHWGEIDIVAKKNSTLSFVEVKTRKSANYGKPYEAVNLSKVKKLMRPVQYFLLQNNYKEYKLSLDVISIMLSIEGTVDKLKHFKNIYS